VLCVCVVWLWQMGLGKTLQSIAFLAYLKDTLKVPGPHLIVVSHPPLDRSS
jgi:SNF2 family DNA or RNA helicase